LKTVTLYHNPRCSKSREALALLVARGLDVTVIEYLKTPPSLNTLKALAEKLGDDKETLFRTNEEAYKSIKTLPFEARLAAICEEPILLERPVVETDKAAVVARPPEKLLDII